ncbi:hypothetical protein [Burkholderia plantarii]|uniref:hypothetical protein n=1 Tax=Burkholderia plantarii TaxID=41899 RepID=UPI000AEB1298|nr:hypothetical protein Bpla01_29220 [Burkholderia plantarii]
MASAPAMLLPRVVPDYYPSRTRLPARIRVFVDDMAEQVRALDLHCASGAAVLPAL